MRYEVDDIVKEVRIAIDQNMTSDALADLGDIDTLSLEQIIRSKIAVGARIVESQAPFYLLDSGKAFADNITWVQERGKGWGWILLPDDFLRLVVFQMTDWTHEVCTPITADDALYAQQFSRYPGIQGNPQKPVVAIVQKPVGLVLEFFTSMAGEEAYVKQARYIPIPRIENNAIELCEKLHDAIVYEAAYLTALSTGQTDLATNLLNIKNELTS